MKLLVVIPHYCGPASSEAAAVYGSQMHALPRVAALNEMLVALHRNFGPKRFAGPQKSLAPMLANAAVLDIVIVTMEGRNVLDRIQVDPSEYQVEYVAVEPLMLSFETQRVARERMGAYDVYAMMEDDLIIHDPDFLYKIQWFQSQFGADAVLQPQRIEVSKAGKLAKSLIEPEIAEPWPEFAHPEAPPTLTASYHSRTLNFEKTNNPHSGCWFLTASQMAQWVKADCFYDRKANWAGPLESAATRALAIRHAIYRAAAPDPFFLEFEHYGVRFANAHADAGLVFQNAPLLRLAAGSTGHHATDGTPVSTARDLFEELAVLHVENKKLRRILNSRSKLTRRLFGRMAGTRL